MRSKHPPILFSSSHFSFMFLDNFLNSFQCNLSFHNQPHNTTPNLSQKSQEMDQRERTQLHSPGICNRLLNSFRKRFAEISLKLAVFACLFSRGLALCCGIFDFIVQHFASQAMKPVTLGTLALDRGTQNQACLESEQASTVLGLSASLPSLSSNGNDFTKDGKKPQPSQDEGRTEVVVPESEAVTQVIKGPPKKTVSINDTAEIIRYEDEEKKKKKATKKSPSLEVEKDEETNLKSILKVGSNMK